jgi:hypothetical protein
VEEMVRAFHIQYTQATIVTEQELHDQDFICCMLSLSKHPEQLWDSFISQKGNSFFGTKLHQLYKSPVNHKILYAEIL